MNFPLLLLVFHLIGFAIGVGAATVKSALVINCFQKVENLPGFLRVSRLITRWIVLGLCCTILSGLGWLVIFEYPLTLILCIKLSLVLLMLLLGPLIDGKLEPALQDFAENPMNFMKLKTDRVLRRFLLAEAIACGAMYAASIIGIVIAHGRSS